MVRQEQRVDLLRVARPGIGSGVTHAESPLERAVLPEQRNRMTALPQQHSSINEAEPLPPAELIDQTDPADPPMTEVGRKHARLQQVYRWRWPVAAMVAVALAGVTYVASLFVPPVYQATVLLRVTTGATSTGSSDGVLAANQLAAQYSQLVLSAGVLGRTADSTGVSQSVLAGSLSGSVQANQNIVTITATAGSAGRASDISAAAGVALADYVAATLVDPGGDVMRTQLLELQASLATARSDAADAASALLASEVTSPERTLAQLQYNAATSQVSNLAAKERELRGDLDVREAEQAVAVTPLGSPTGPQVTSPQPGLYALIAAAVTMLIAAQVISSINRRRRA